MSLEHLRLVEQRPEQFVDEPAPITWPNGHTLRFITMPEIDYDVPISSPGRILPVQERAFGLVYDFTDWDGKPTRVYFGCEDNPATMLKGDIRDLRTNTDRRILNEPSHRKPLLVRTWRQHGFFPANAFYVQEIFARSNDAFSPDRPQHPDTIRIAVDYEALVADERRMLDVLHVYSHTKALALEGILIDALAQPVDPIDARIIRQTVGMDRYIDECQSLVRRYGRMRMLLEDEVGITPEAEKRQYQGLGGKVRYLKDVLEREHIDRPSFYQLRSDVRQFSELVTRFEERFSWALALHLRRKMRANLGYESNADITAHIEDHLATMPKDNLDRNKPGKGYKKKRKKQVVVYNPNPQPAQHTM